MPPVQPSFTFSIKHFNLVAPNISRSSAEGTRYGVMLRMTRDSFRFNPSHGLESPSTATVARGVQAFILVQSGFDSHQNMQDIQ